MRATGETKQTSVEGEEIFLGKRLIEPAADQITAIRLPSDMPDFCEEDAGKAGVAAAQADGNDAAHREVSADEEPNSDRRNITNQGRIRMKARLHHELNGRPPGAIRARHETSVALRFRRVAASWVLEHGSGHRADALRMFAVRRHEGSRRMADIPGGLSSLSFFSMAIRPSAPFTWRAPAGLLGTSDNVARQACEPRCTPTFGAAGITCYLLNDARLEHWQRTAAHEPPVRALRCTSDQVRPVKMGNIIFACGSVNSLIHRPLRPDIGRRSPPAVQGSVISSLTCEDTTAGKPEQPLTDVSGDMRNPLFTRIPSLMARSFPCRY
jgi:hypothetical protein